MVFLSHIQYSSGLRMPLAEIRRMTRDRNILILLDGAQAAGHIPLDMKEMGCDFYSIPGQKWLLGAEGNRCTVHTRGTDLSAGADYGSW